ncbi:UNVERIFIED_CONTAM: hypothetical protein Sradi_5830700 [Sesamum radiatum]|uniref:Uncharacterized protein n=1 Tax=Sesamum radiatum TaxID=300843 RepID=A0AAW2KQB4_SESRA
MADPPRRRTFSDTSTEQVSPALLQAIQQIVSAAIREQVAALALACVATQSYVDILEEEVEEGGPIHAPPVVARQDPPTGPTRGFSAVACKTGVPLERPPRRPVLDCRAPRR